MNKFINIFFVFCFALKFDDIFATASKQKAEILYNQSSVKLDSIQLIQKYNRIRQIENEYFYKKPFLLIIVDGVPINNINRDSVTGYFRVPEFEGYHPAIDSFNYNDITKISFIKNDNIGHGNSDVLLIITKYSTSNSKKKKRK